jgi:hypothetical protein
MGTGKATQYGQCATLLLADGALQVVANRHIPPKRRRLYRQRHLQKLERLLASLRGAFTGGVDAAVQC